MRLHRLEVTAFGPYAGTETVDFDALAVGGVFLFTGSTGAGKTSLLDAVCFALYGQVPGARAKAARSLRSDHAADGVAPQVVLELTLSGRRLRITRSPGWERPKRRGSGTVAAQAAVHLEERAATGWSTLATRLDEAGDLVGRLLGLRLPQFCQVVLLPQGQFADFLRADAENRRDLLESLFDTVRFTEVERWLVARRQESSRALDDVDRRLDRVLARIAEASGQDRPEDVSGSDAVPWADGLLTSARAGHARADAVAALAAEQVEVAAARLEAATLVAEAHQRRTALEERRAALATAEEAAVGWRRELAAARAVGPVLPLVTEVARLQHQLDATRAAIAATSGDLSRALAGSGSEPVTVPWPAAEVLTGVAREHRSEAAALRALAKDEDEAARLAQAARALESRIVELDGQARTLRDRLEDSPTRRAALTASRDKSAAATAALPGVVAELARADERLAAGRSRDRLLEDRSRMADRVRSRADAELTARSAWLDLRRARIDGMAAELAAGLAQGLPCPVCGGTEHPNAAQPGPRAVTKAAEDRAATQARGAERALEEARLELAQVEAELAAASAGAGGTAAVADLESARDLVADRVGELTRRAATADADTAALDTLAEQHESWLRDSVALDEEARSVRQKIDEDQDRLGRLRAGLDAARGDDPTIAARALRLVRAADDVEALARQVADEQRLAGEVTEALERAETAAVDRGLGSVEEVVRDHRDDVVTGTLEALVADHAAEVAAVEDQLGEVRLAALADGPAPDVVRLRDDLAEVERRRDEAAEVRAMCSQRATSLVRLTTMLHAVLAERAPVAEAHRTVDGLARLAEGKGADNRLRMSLSGYVLAARLEQVAVAASQRLARMTSDRYRLVHTDAPGSARVRGGLTLRVLDAWTGVARDPATLSGGETFTASLALALGLADVVTAEAGGALLETLFVDEGFGSLDDESLDDVMGVLDGLRDGGRTVGLVSHVADLRQRIPVQLRVEKGRTGSHVRQ
ncbi:MAG TPA: SMC family ATPase [Actinomycetes bacterium]|jgi:exonuclease SbcC|nr:SMC family ATPase [Actinomycetes bacterium]